MIALHCIVLYCIEGQALHFALQALPVAVQVGNWNGAEKNLLQLIQREQQSNHQRFNSLENQLSDATGRMATKEAMASEVSKCIGI